MGQVTITLNGRSFRLRCGDGEEARLIALAEHVERKLAGLVAEFGQVGDERLLVMASIMITDELFDAREALAAATGNATDAVADDPSIELAAPRPAIPTGRPGPAAVREPPPPPEAPPPPEPPLLEDQPGDPPIKRAMRRHEAVRRSQ